MSALRRFFARRRLLPLTALVLRARTVRTWIVFVTRELARSRETCLYRLVDSDLRVAIRHGTADAVTLGEVFHDHDYVPDAALAQRLAGTRRVVDLGANIGLFGAFAAARWPEARIIAYEPDPANLELLRRTVAANGLGDRWSVVPAAAGARQGSISFVAGEASLSRIVEDGTAGATTVAIEDVMDIIADADLLKMDIEGGEWAILSDPRFAAAPPRVVVLEYHPHLCPANNARAAALEALAGAGMLSAPIKDGPAGHGMLWAWRA